MKASAAASACSSAILIGIVNWFLLPVGDRQHLRQARVARSRSRGVTGFWNLIPLIGWIIWVVKVQGAMNRLYE